MTKELQEKCHQVLYYGIEKYFCADLTYLIVAYDNRKKLKNRENVDFLRGYYNYQIKECYNFNEALRGASYGGHIEAIALLIHYGANNFNEALGIASHNGQICAMELLITQYGADYFNDSLLSASDSGQICAMERLIRYGASNFNTALIFASRAGHICAIKLLKHYGANNFNLALQWTICGGNEHIEAMKLLRHYGANNLQVVLEGARVRGKVKAIELLQSWIS